MTDFSPGSPLSILVVLISGGGLTALIKLVLDALKDRRAAQAAERLEARQEARQEREAPAQEDSAALALADTMMTLSARMVDQSNADQERKTAALEVATEALERQTTATVEATRALEAATALQARTVDALIEAHDWIDAGAQPPPPAWPHWLPRRRHD